MGFQIRGLARSMFDHLFDLDEQGLRQHRARRVVADKPRAFPCRVSLEDAEPGEELILVHHEHLPADSPFRSSHAVYVRVAAEERRPAPNEVPALFRTRMMSVRAFDRNDMMQAAEVVDGREVEGAIDRLLGDPAVAYVHLHYAAPGCFAAWAERT